MMQPFEVLVDVLVSDRDPARWGALFTPGARFVDHTSIAPETDAVGHYERYCATLQNQT